MEAGGLSPNPDSRELLTSGNINWQKLIKRLHTYTETEHHARAKKFQGNTYQANSPATQEHSPELQDTGCPKSPQNHRHLITHYWTLHCTPERRNPAPPTRTPTQASLTRKPWQATYTNPHTLRKCHNKENSTNCQNTERTPQTQQFKQVEETEEYPAGKEQDKCPPNQTKEEEIGNLPDKEFRIMIVKLIQNLKIKMESQINSLETRIEKMQERFNKDLEEIKKESIYNE